MMKDDIGVWECFALPYKLGLNADQKRGKDPMIKDNSAGVLGNALLCLTS
jgi:hypothetical protein